MVTESSGFPYKSTNSSLPLKCGRALPSVRSTGSDVRGSGTQLRNLSTRDWLVSVFPDRLTASTSEARKGQQTRLSGLSSYQTKIVYPRKTIWLSRYAGALPAGLVCHLRGLGNERRHSRLLPGSVHIELIPSKRGMEYP